MFVFGLVILFVVAGLSSHALLISSPRPSAPSPSASSDPTTCSLEELRDLDYSRTDQGELAWADEFDGTAVDPRRWTVRDRTTLSFDQAVIRARNVAVHDGTLAIEARRESMRDRDYTTGYLDTIGHFSQRHGRWEIRARLPVAAGSSRGLWPAFWLRADDASGEIDVMEAWGTPADHPRDRSVHLRVERSRGHQRAGRAPAAAAITAGARRRTRRHWRTTSTSSPSTGHPTCLKFTLDGHVTGSLALDAATWMPHSLRGKFNIRLNLQVGSSFWGRVDETRPESTRLPARLEVDYVRVFRQKS